MDERKKRELYRWLERTVLSDLERGVPKHEVIKRLLNTGKGSMSQKEFNEIYSTVMQWGSNPSALRTAFKLKFGLPTSTIEAVKFRANQFLEGVKSFAKYPIGIGQMFWDYFRYQVPDELKRLFGVGYSIEGDAIRVALQPQRLERHIRHLANYQSWMTPSMSHYRGLTSQGFANLFSHLKEIGVLSESDLNSIQMFYEDYKRRTGREPSSKEITNFVLKLAKPKAEKIRSQYEELFKSPQNLFKYPEVASLVSEGLKNRFRLEKSDALLIAEEIERNPEQAEKILQRWKLPKDAIDKIIRDINAVRSASAQNKVSPTLLHYWWAIKPHYDELIATGRWEGLPSDSDAEILKSAWMGTREEAVLDLMTAILPLDLGLVGKAGQAIKGAKVTKFLPKALKVTPAMSEIVNQVAKGIAKREGLKIAGRNVRQAINVMKPYIYHGAAVGMLPAGAVLVASFASDKDISTPDAAYEAAKYLTGGMVLGLGIGSLARVLPATIRHPKIVQIMTEIAKATHFSDLNSEVEARKLRRAANRMFLSEAASWKTNEIRDFGYIYRDDSGQVILQGNMPVHRAIKANQSAVYTVGDRRSVRERLYTYDRNQLVIDLGVYNVRDISALEETVIPSILGVLAKNEVDVSKGSAAIFINAEMGRDFGYRVLLSLYESPQKQANIPQLVEDLLKFSNATEDNTVVNIGFGVSDGQKSLFVTRFAKGVKSRKYIDFMGKIGVPMSDFETARVSPYRKLLGESLEGLKSKGLTVTEYKLENAANRYVSAAMKVRDILDNMSPSQQAELERMLSNYNMTVNDLYDALDEVINNIPQRRSISSNAESVLRAIDFNRTLRENRIVLHPEHGFVSASLYHPEESYIFGRYLEIVADWIEGKMTDTQKEELAEFVPFFVASNISELAEDFIKTVKELRESGVLSEKEFAAIRTVEELASEIASKVGERPIDEQFRIVRHTGSPIELKKLLRETSQVKSLMQSILSDKFAMTVNDLKDVVRLIEEGNVSKAKSMLRNASKVLEHIESLFGEPSEYLDAFKAVSGLADDYKEIKNRLFELYIKGVIGDEDLPAHMVSSWRKLKDNDVAVKALSEFIADPTRNAGKLVEVLRATKPEFDFDKLWSALSLPVSNRQKAAVFFNEMRSANKNAAFAVPLLVRPEGILNGDRIASWSMPPWAGVIYSQIADIDGYHKVTEINGRPVWLAATDEETLSRIEALLTSPDFLDDATKWEQVAELLGTDKDFVPYYWLLLQSDAIHYALNEAFDIFSKTGDVGIEDLTVKPIWDVNSLLAVTGQTAESLITGQPVDLPFKQARLHMSRSLLGANYVVDDESLKSFSVGTIIPEIKLTTPEGMQVSAVTVLNAYMSGKEVPPVPVADFLKSFRHFPEYTFVQLKSASGNPLPLYMFIKKEDAENTIRHIEVLQSLPADVQSEILSVYDAAVSELGKSVLTTPLQRAIAASHLLWQGQPFHQKHNNPQVIVSAFNTLMKPQINPVDLVYHFADQYVRDVHSEIARFMPTMLMLHANYWTPNYLQLNFNMMRLKDAILQSVKAIKYIDTSNFSQASLAFLETMPQIVELDLANPKAYFDATHEWWSKFLNNVVAQNDISSVRKFVTDILTVAQKRQSALSRADITDQISKFFVDLWKVCNQGDTKNVSGFLEGLFTAAGRDSDRMLDMLATALASYDLAKKQWVQSFRSGIQVNKVPIEIILSDTLKKLPEEHTKLVALLNKSVDRYALAKPSDFGRYRSALKELLVNRMGLLTEDEISAFLDNTNILSQIFGRFLMTSKAVGDIGSVVRKFMDTVKEIGAEGKSQFHLWLSEVADANLSGQEKQLFLNAVNKLIDHFGKHGVEVVAGLAASISGYTYDTPATAYIFAKKLFENHPLIVDRAAKMFLDFLKSTEHPIANLAPESEVMEMLKRSLGERLAWTLAYTLMTPKHVPNFDWWIKTIADNLLVASFHIVSDFAPQLPSDIGRLLMRAFVGPVAEIPETSFWSKVRLSDYEKERAIKVLRNEIDKLMASLDEVTSSRERVILAEKIDELKRQLKELELARDIKSFKDFDSKLTQVELAIYTKAQELEPFQRYVSIESKITDLMNRLNQMADEAINSGTQEPIGGSKDTLRQIQSLFKGVYNKLRKLIVNTVDERTVQLLDRFVAVEEFKDLRPDQIKRFSAELSKALSKMKFQLQRRYVSRAARDYKTLLKILGARHTQNFYINNMHPDYTSFAVSRLRRVASLGDFLLSEISRLRDFIGTPQEKVKFTNAVERINNFAKRQAVIKNIMPNGTVKTHELYMPITEKALRQLIKFLDDYDRIVSEVSLYEEGETYTGALVGYTENVLRDELIEFMPPTKELTEEIERQTINRFLNEYLGRITTYEEREFLGELTDANDRASYLFWRMALATNQFVEDQLGRFFDHIVAQEKLVGRDVRDIENFVFRASSNFGTVLGRTFVDFLTDTKITDEYRLMTSLPLNHWFAANYAYPQFADIAFKQYELFNDLALKVHEDAYTLKEHEIAYAAIEERLPDDPDMLFDEAEIRRAIIGDEMIGEYEPDDVSVMSKQWGDSDWAFSVKTLQTLKEEKLMSPQLAFTRSVAERMSNMVVPFAKFAADAMLSVRDLETVHLLNEFMRLYSNPETRGEALKHISQVKVSLNNFANLLNRFADQLEKFPIYRDIIAASPTMRDEVKLLVNKWRDASHRLAIISQMLGDAKSLDKAVKELTSFHMQEYLDNLLSEITRIGIQFADRFGVSSPIFSFFVFPTATSFVAKAILGVTFVYIFVRNLFNILSKLPWMKRRMENISLWVYRKLAGSTYGAVDILAQMKEELPEIINASASRQNLYNIGREIVELRAQLNSTNERLVSTAQELFGLIPPEYATKSTPAYMPNFGNLANDFLMLHMMDTNTIRTIWHHLGYSPNWREKLGMFVWENLPDRVTDPNQRQAIKQNVAQSIANLLGITDQQKIDQIAQNLTIVDKHDAIRSLFNGYSPRQNPNLQPSDAEFQSQAIVNTVNLIRETIRERDRLSAQLMKKLMERKKQVVNAMGQSGLALQAWDSWVYYNHLKTRHNMLKQPNLLKEYTLRVQAEIQTDQKHFEDLLVPFVMQIVNPQHEVYGKARNTINALNEFFSLMTAIEGGIIGTKTLGHPQYSTLLSDLFYIEAAMERPAGMSFLDKVREVLGPQSQEIQTVEGIVGSLPSITIGSRSIDANKFLTFMGNTDSVIKLQKVIADFLTMLNDSDRAAEIEAILQGRGINIGVDALKRNAENLLSTVKELHHSLNAKPSISETAATQIDGWMTQLDRLYSTKVRIFEKHNELVNPEYKLYLEMLKLREELIDQFGWTPKSNDPLSDDFFALEPPQHLKRFVDRLNKFFVESPDAATQLRRFFAANLSFAESAGFLEPLLHPMPTILKIAAAVSGGYPVQAKEAQLGAQLTSLLSVRNQMAELNVTPILAALTVLFDHDTNVEVRRMPQKGLSQVMMSVIDDVKKNKLGLVQNTAQFLDPRFSNARTEKAMEVASLIFAHALEAYGTGDLSLLDNFISRLASENIISDTKGAFKDFVFDKFYPVLSRWLEYIGRETLNWINYARQMHGYAPLQGEARWFPRYARTIASRFNEFFKMSFDEQMAIIEKAVLEDYYPEYLKVPEHKRMASEHAYAGIGTVSWKTAFDDIVEAIYTIARQNAFADIWLWANEMTQVWQKELLMPVSKMTETMLPIFSSQLKDYLNFLVFGRMTSFVGESPIRKAPDATETMLHYTTTKGTPKSKLDKILKGFAEHIGLSERETILGQKIVGGAKWWTFFRAFFARPSIAIRQTESPIKGAMVHSLLKDLLPVDNIGGFDLTKVSLYNFLKACAIVMTDPNYVDKIAMYSDNLRTRQARGALLLTHHYAFEPSQVRFDITTEIQSILNKASQASEDEVFEMIKNGQLITAAEKIGQKISAIAEKGTKHIEWFDNAVTSISWLTSFLTYLDYAKKAGLKLDNHVFLKAVEFAEAATSVAQGHYGRVGRNIAFVRYPLIGTMWIFRNYKLWNYYGFIFPMISEILENRLKSVGNIWPLLLISFAAWALYSWAWKDAFGVTPADPPQVFEGIRNIAQTHRIPFVNAALGYASEMFVSPFVETMLPYLSASRMLSVFEPIAALTNIAGQTVSTAGAPDYYKRLNRMYKDFHDRYGERIVSGLIGTEAMAVYKTAKEILSGTAKGRNAIDTVVRLSMGIQRQAPSYYYNRWFNDNRVAGIDKIRIFVRTLRDLEKTPYYIGKFIVDSRSRELATFYNALNQNRDIIPNEVFERGLLPKLETLGQIRSLTDEIMARDNHITPEDIMVLRSLINGDPAFKKLCVGLANYWGGSEKDEKVLFDAALFIGWKLLHGRYLKEQEALERKETMQASKERAIEEVSVR